MNRAFTLIELMVVISLMVILAMLALPAMNVARKASDNAICVTNLRKVGLGIQGYCLDNDGTLPGPIYQGLIYSFDYPNATLTSFLCSALNGVTPAKGQSVQIPSALCPAYKRRVSSSQWNFAYYAVYRVWTRNNTVLYNGTDLVTPWGHSGTGVNNKPLTWAALVAAVDPAAQWAVRDADCVSYGTYAGLPSTPVHGGYWNQLYFDWHVEALRIADRRSPND